MDKRMQAVLRLLKSLNVYGEFHHIMIDDNFLASLKDNTNEFYYNMIHSFIIKRQSCKVGHIPLDSVDRAWNTLLYIFNLPHWSDYNDITPDNSIFNSLLELDDIQRYKHILTQ